MIYRALDVLVKVAEARYPQLAAVILGVMGAGTGLLFLLRADKFNTEPSMSTLLDFAPTIVWGLLFLIAGVCLVNTAFVNYRKTFWYCLVLARLMGLFAIASGLGLFRGEGIGLLSLYTLGFGWLCDLNAVAAISPWLKRVVRRHDAETVGAEVAG
jgi:hypothetical protein